MSKLAFRAQTVDVAYLPLSQEFVGKKCFNDRSKGFRFGQKPVSILPNMLLSAIVDVVSQIYRITADTSRGGSRKDNHEKTHVLGFETLKKRGIHADTIMYGGGGMIPIISSNLSALRAFGKKMAVIANNVANIDSEGFKKSRAVLKEGPVNNVSVEIGTVETPGPLVPVEEGGKTVPKETSNVELAEEIPQASLTKTYYQANLAVLIEEDEMLGTLLDILE
jgi:flagellar basal body rod protein FlgC